MLAGKQKSLGEAAEMGGGEGLKRMIPFISASVICSKSAKLLTFATGLRNLLDDHGNVKIAMILDEKTGEIKTGPPNVSKMGEVRNTGVENACLKVQQSREALKATREEYQRSFENFKKQNEELTEIFCTMRGYQVKEVAFDTARKMLIKGLEALSRVKEQWEKMVRFFQMISNLIETSLVWSMKEFADTVDGAQKVSSYSSKAFMADLVYGHIFNASSVAQLVAMISEIYTMVSEKYLMERKKAEFEKSLEARAEAIEKEMRAVLPANGEAAEPHLRTDGHEEETKFI
ncbi:hypothetical protein NXF25_004616 [Crotalus adamanteus]|uniref:Uncharacterized protein n=1 Tax=Crotalus adamanteus TaxID=8729 RepID=A0AAW1BWH5_CROAD